MNRVSPTWLHLLVVVAFVWSSWSPAGDTASPPSGADTAPTTKTTDPLGSKLKDDILAWAKKIETEREKEKLKWNERLDRAVENWLVSNLSPSNLLNMFADKALSAGVGWAFSAVADAIFGASNEPVDLTEKSIREIASAVRAELDEIRLDQALQRYEAMMRTWREYSNAPLTSISFLERLIGDTQYLLTEFEGIGMPAAYAYTLLASLRCQVLQEYMLRTEDPGHLGSLHDQIERDILPHLKQLNAAFLAAHDARFSEMWSQGLGGGYDGPSFMYFQVKIDGERRTVHEYDFDQFGADDALESQFEREQAIAESKLETIREEYLKELNTEILDGLNAYAASLARKIRIGFQLGFEQLDDGHWVLHQQAKPIGTHLVMTMQTQGGAAKTFYDRYYFFGSQELLTGFRIPFPITAGDTVSVMATIGHREKKFLVPVPSSMDYHPGAFQARCERRGFDWNVEYEIIPPGGPRVDAKDTYVEHVSANGEIARLGAVDLRGQVVLSDYGGLIAAGDVLRFHTSSRDHHEKWPYTIPKGVSNYPGSVSAQIGKQGDTWLLDYIITPPAGLQASELRLDIELVPYDDVTSRRVDDAQFSNRVDLTQWQRPIRHGDVIRFVISDETAQRQLDFQVPSTVDIPN
ncbi:MAG: hypothetical protein GY722_14420 [bacterium]|nr:hypothetical protein [bacterium]